MITIDITANDLRFIFLKKVTSLNPEKYEKRNLNNLIDGYRFYLMSFYKNPEQVTGYPKYFEEWLKTEI